MGHKDRSSSSQAGARLKSQRPYPHTPHAHTTSTHHIRPQPTRSTVKQPATPRIFYPVRPFLPSSLLPPHTKERLCERNSRYVGRNAAIYGVYILKSLLATEHDTHTRSISKNSLSLSILISTKRNLDRLIPARHVWQLFFITPSVRFPPH